jgi:Tfp pilus assembly protein PilX
MSSRQTKRALAKDRDLLLQQAAATVEEGEEEEEEEEVESQPKRGGFVNPFDLVRGPLCLLQACAAASIQLILVSAGKANELN